MSACHHTDHLTDDANPPHQPQPLSHLAALLREMQHASLPIAQIAQQQAQRVNERHAA